MPILDYTEHINYKFEHRNDPYPSGRPPSNIQDFYAELSKLTGVCGYCQCPVKKVYDKSTIRPGLNFEVGYHALAWECLFCGYWEMEIKNPWENDSGVMGGLDLNYRRAILRKFKEEDNSLPIETLKEYLFKNEDILQNISSSKMEQLAKSILSDFLQCEIIHCGKSYDGGIDLYAVENNIETIAFQVKRRKNQSRAESVSLIREFLGAMIIKGFNRGVIISTATRFSNTSKHAVKTILEEGILTQFDLIDRDKFLSIFNLVSKEKLRPWEMHFKKINFTPWGII